MKQILFSLILASSFVNAESNFVRQEKIISKPPHDALTPQRIKLSTGVELEYAEKGSVEKPALIFLHGYSDSWHSFENVMKLFPDELHVIAISQRGHGNSTKPKAGYHPKDFAKDVAVFIKQKNLGRCIVVGHSMGGLVTEQFALDYPELTKAIVLIDTDADFNDNPGFPEFIGDIMKFEKPVDYSFAKEFQVSTLSSPIDSAFLTLYIDESLKLPLHVWKGAGEGMLAVNFSTDLQQIEAPVLIFWGSNDSICSKADQQNLVQNLKSSKLIVYEATGHALHWEEPERFTTDVTTFVSGLEQ